MIDGGSIRSCNNLGNVMVDSSKSAWNYVGGVAGSAHGSIEDSQNNGEVNLTEKGINDKENYIDSQYYIGGITGWMDQSIRNCFNYGKIIASATNISKNKDILVGGIVGMTNASGVYNCFNTGEIEQNVISSKGSITGGIVGYCKYASQSIENCKNTGYVHAYVEGTYYAWAGGIIGGCSESSTVTISKCANKGNSSSIKLEGKLNRMYINQQKNNEHVLIGGIAGCLDKNSTIDQCYNEKSIEGYITCGVEKYISAGGVAGESYGNVRNCYNIGSVQGNNKDSTSGMTIGGIAGFLYSGGTLEQSYNASINIFRANSSSYQKPKNEFKGLITGYNEANIKNVFYLSTSNNSIYYATDGAAGGSNAGMNGYTNSQLQNSTFASILGNTYWASSNTINNGYPYLKNNIP